MAGQRELMRIVRLTAREAEIDERIGSLEGPGLLSGAFLAPSGDTVYTADEIAGGIIERDPNGGDRMDTTDDADAIIEACGLTEDGMYHECLLLNDADATESITLAGGSGVTIANPEQLVFQRQAATMLFHRTGDVTVRVYLKGGIGA